MMIILLPFINYCHLEQEAMLVYRHDMTVGSIMYHSTIRIGNNIPAACRYTITFKDMLDLVRSV